VARKTIRVSDISGAEIPEGRLFVSSLLMLGAARASSMSPTLRPSSSVAEQSLGAAANQSRARSHGFEVDPERLVDGSSEPRRELPADEEVEEVEGGDALPVTVSVQCFCWHRRSSRQIGQGRLSRLGHLCWGRAFPDGTMRLSLLRGLGVVGRLQVARTVNLSVFRRHPCGASALGSACKSA
jgi:hypothetical protein